jgi:hypothetical protein
LLQDQASALVAAQEERDHHKGKRTVAKQEMIALAAALECERGLRKGVNVHIANTATPKAYDIAAGLELELRKLEEVLVLLSAKAGRVWEGQSFVGGPGPIVVVGQSPMHATGAAALSSASGRSPTSHDGGNRRMTAAKEAEAAQHEMLGSLASQLARLSAGLSNFSSANDLLKELAEQQTLTNAMRVMCSSSAKSLASLASPPAGSSGASGSSGGGSRAAKNASRASRNAAAARGNGAVGKYGKLAPVLTPGGWNSGSGGAGVGDDEDASSMDGWSNSPPPSPQAPSSSRRAAGSSSRSGGGNSTPFATPSGVSPGLSFRGNETRGDESSVDLSVRLITVRIIISSLLLPRFASEPPHSLSFKDDLNSACMQWSVCPVLRFPRHFVRRLTWHFSCILHPNIIQVDGGASVDDFFDGPSTPRNNSSHLSASSVGPPPSSANQSMRVVRLGGLKHTNNNSQVGAGNNGSSPSSGRSGSGDVELLQSKSPSVFS